MNYIYKEFSNIIGFGIRIIFEIKLREIGNFKSILN